MEGGQGRSLKQKPQKSTVRWLTARHMLIFLNVLALLRLSQRFWLMILLTFILIADTGIAASVLITYLHHPCPQPLLPSLALMGPTSQRILDPV